MEATTLVKVSNPKDYINHEQARSLQCGTSFQKDQG